MFFVVVVKNVSSLLPGKKESDDLMDLELELYPSSNGQTGSKSGGGKASSSKRAPSAKKKREAQQAALLAKQAQEGGFNPFLGVLANKDPRKEEISYDWVSDA